MVYAADLGSVASGVEVRVLSKARIRKKMKELEDKLNCLSSRNRIGAADSYDIISKSRNVAQFGSAYRLGRWGQEFESLHSENFY